MSRFGPFLLYAGLALVGRVASLGTPPGGDLGQYMYVGGAVLDGDAPYAEIANNKGPANFVLFAVVRAIAGGSPDVVRILLVVATALGAMALAGVVSKHAGSAAGVVAGATFALLSSASEFEGFDPTSYQFALPIVLAGWWLATLPGRRAALGAGAVTAFVCLINPVFAIVAPFVVWELVREQPPRHRHQRVGQAALGAGLLAAPFVIWLVAVGAVDGMIAQVVGQAERSIALDRGSAGAHQPGEAEAPLQFLLDLPDSILWVAGLAGCAAAARDRRLRPLAIAMAAWIVLWFLRVALASYDFPNQYVPALAGISAGIALAVESTRPATVHARAALAAMLLAPLVWAAIAAPQLREFAQPAASRGNTAIQPVVDFIERRTPRGAPIFVEGYAPQVYWLADRRAPTRYFDGFGLQGDATRLRERNATIAADPPAALAAFNNLPLDRGLAPLVSRWYRLAYDRNGARVWLRR